MNIRNALTSIFKIQPGEERLVLVLLALSFCFGFARVFTLTASGTLFLVAFGAQFLPYVYIAVALVIPVIGFLYAGLETRLSLRSLLIVNLGGLVVTLSVLWFNLALTDARWPAFALAVSFEIVWVMTSLALWGLAGRLLNVRQGKRLFGFIGSGDVVAATLGGLLAPLLVGWLGTPSLLLGAVGALTGALGLVVLIIRVFGGALPQGTEDVSRARQNTTAVGMQRRYMMLIMALAILSSATYYFIDNIFFRELEAWYADETRLANFLGIFFAIINLLTLLSNLFIVSPIITRYGVRTGLLILPVLTIVTTAGLIVSGAFLILPLLVFCFAALSYLCDWTFRETVYNSSLRILYQPLPVGQRLRLQTYVEGMGQPLAQGLAGLALLGLSLVDFDSLELSYVLLGMLVACLVLSLPLGRQYTAMVMQALTKRRLGGDTLVLADHASMAMAWQALTSPYPGVALYALDLLEQQAHPSLTDGLRQVLAHPVPEVRQEALKRIERLALTSALEDVRHRVAVEPDSGVRGTAVRVLAELDDGNLLEWTMPYLNHPDASVRLGAMTGLLRSGHLEGVLLAGQELYGLAQSPDPANRAMAAQVLGDVGVRSFSQPVLTLLADPHPMVRRMALEASAKLKSPRLWPAVITAVGVHDQRAHAIAALVAGGDAVIPELRAVFAQPGVSREIMRYLLHVAGRIGGEGAMALLKEHLASPDPELRHQALLALNRCGYRAIGPEWASMHQLVSHEVAQATRLMAVLIDIGNIDTAALLNAALGEEIERCREHVFLLLACLYDRQIVMRVRDNLAQAATDKQAYALEAVDMLIARELKPLIFPLVENLTPAQRLQRLEVMFPQSRLSRLERLHEIITALDGQYSPWVSACAVYALAPETTGEVATFEGIIAPAFGLRVRSTTTWSPAQLDPAVDPTRFAALEQGAAMLSVIEKVLILKTVSIFAGTPDSILAKVAMLLEEQELNTGEILFSKGDVGRCMYIIVTGSVRVHDEERLLNELGERDIVGEMAVLDSTPRSASVTAMEETTLLRLDQDALYELMADRIEVVRGIIRVLCEHLRAPSPIQRERDGGQR